MTTISKLEYLKDTKQIIKSAIESKGVEVPAETPFRQYANKITDLSHVLVVTQQEYDDLVTKEPNTLYVIPEE